MNFNKRYILYGVIVVVCIIAIIIAVYSQLFNKPSTPSENKMTIENTIVEQPIQNPKDVLAEFNSLFTNKFEVQGYHVDKIKKIEDLEAQDIIYTAYNIQEDNEKYSIDIKIPVVNIAGNVASNFNQTTQKIFADKASNVLQGPEKYTVYSLDYIGYLNDNILSLVIKSTLKEGTNAQRIIVQTYNYDIVNDKELTLNEVLDIYGKNTRDVNKIIDNQIKEASQQATTIAQATGQIVYKRDINNSMYTTDNASNFFVGKDGQIYIVYAYGNNNVTSEIDIIKI